MRTNKQDMRLHRFCVDHAKYQKSLTYIDIFQENPEDTEVPYLIEHGEEKMLHRHNLTVMQGKKKQGKTAGAICFVMALLAGEYNGLRSHESNPIVLWVDTEMGNAETRKRMRLMVDKLGIDRETACERLKVISLKTVPKANEMRLTALERAIQEVCPDLVVLDGVADMVRDFNQSDECFGVLERLGAIVEETGIALLTMIHENRQDGNAKGHAGAACDQKAYEIYAVKKEEHGSSVKYIEGRGAPCTGFQFAFDDNGVPVPPQDVVNREFSEYLETWRDVVGSLSTKGEGYRSTDLVNAYKGKYGCTPRTAQRAIQSAVSRGVLLKEGDGKNTTYTVCFHGIGRDDIL